MISPPPVGKGGASGTGGAAANGGAQGSGGSAANGGSPAAGGTSGSGGVQSSGGSIATGGRTATGGATGTGGGSGGIASSGGATNSGGRPGSGGATGGSQTGASGGTTGTGGTSGTGGSTAAGGTAGATTRPDGAAGGGASGTGGATSRGDASAGGTGGGAAGDASAGGSTGTGGSGMSTGCGKAPGIASSQYNNGKPIAITAANMQRRYILSVPTNYDNSKAYKLVISFHQRDGNDIQNYSWQYYGLLPLSNNTTIFVAPNGQLNGAPCSGTGNGETSCGWPNPNNSDLALADAVVAQIEANFCVDTNRIFATGWSYGGAMSYETACARPLSGGGSGYIRAVAVYSGSPQITQGPCPPSKAVAYYASHGTQDNVLQYSGGVSMAQDFAKANACTWATPTQATGAHVCTNLTGCSTGYPVEFCSFVGPHTPYPDNGQSSGSWGPGEAWKFLNQF